MLCFKLPRLICPVVGIERSEDIYPFEQIFSLHLYIFTFIYTSKSLSCATPPKHFQPAFAHRTSCYRHVVCSISFRRWRPASEQQSVIFQIIDKNYSSPVLIRNYWPKIKGFVTTKIKCSASHAIKFPGVYKMSNNSFFKIFLKTENNNNRIPTGMLLANRHVQTTSWLNRLFTVHYIFVKLQTVSKQYVFIRWVQGHWKFSICACDEDNGNVWQGRKVLA